MKADLIKELCEVEPMAAGAQKVQDTKRLPELGSQAERDDFARGFRAYCKSTRLRLCSRAFMDSFNRGLK